MDQICDEGLCLGTYSRKLKSPARDLRSNMTEAEQVLWSRLRRKQVHGVQFYRQKPLGPFIVDFFAPGVGLVIEVDGSQHLEPDHLERDRQRDRCLVDDGLLVLRYDNRQVLLETDGVVEQIAEEIVRRRKSPLAPLSGGCKLGVKVPRTVPRTGAGGWESNSLCKRNLGDKAKSPFIKRGI